MHSDTGSDDEVRRERITRLERENDRLARENAALRKKLDDTQAVLRGLLAKVDETLEKLT